jgi:hypothetical protein
VKSAAHLGAGGLQGGEEAEEQSGDRRHQNAERGEADIELEVDPAGHGVGQQGDDGPQSETAEQHAGDSSHQREQPGFGKQLTDNAASRSADGGADGDFMGPR